MKNYRFLLKNLDCANCAKKIEDKIAEDKRFLDVNVNFSTSKISLKSNEENTKEEISKIIYSIEPDVELLEEGVKIEENERNSKDIIRLIIGVLIYFVGMVISFGIVVSNVFTIISLIILLSKTAKKAYKQIIKNKVLDENTLITISCIGAFLVGKGMEAVMVISLYEIGKILEAKAISKTRKSISNLMDIKPEYANLKSKNKIIKVKPEEVKIGDIITVKSGEKIPLDGIVIKGNAKLDNSALTGESKLINVEEKSNVLSGSINTQGILEIQVGKTYENSTVSQILNLVENATDKKAKTETFVAKAAKIYTPIVLGLALIVAIFMPLFYKEITYSQSIYKALIFLVISCPCSIAISVPLSYFTGIGKASRRGILVKGSDYLDGIKDINEIIFDKTGTITTGKFEVSKINVSDNNYTQEELLNYMAIGEKFSNHPIAESIVKKAEEVISKEISTENIKKFKEIAGKGIEYEYDGKIIKIGNSNFIETTNKQEEQTEIYLKIDNDIIGYVEIKDEIKSKTKFTIDKLRKLGIKTKIFTGDKKEVAVKIAKEIGVNQLKSEMLPTDKYKELEEELQNNKKENKNGKIAYVGDGINDSPVLARADIGISMGGIGQSSAIEASDVVIMTDELDKILDAISISKKTNIIIKQNLIFAIGVKIMILILSLFGIADMWEAVFADVGTTLITIFNTIRILK